MLRAELDGESRSEAKEHAPFYLRGCEASKAARRVLRNVIVRSGCWRSSATDTYMRMQDAGIRLGDALL